MLPETPASAYIEQVKRRAGHPENRSELSTELGSRGQDFNGAASIAGQLHLLPIVTLIATIVRR